MERHFISLHKTLMNSSYGQVYKDDISHWVLSSIRIQRTEQMEYSTSNLSSYAEEYNNNNQPSYFETTFYSFHCVEYGTSAAKKLEYREEAVAKTNQKTHNSHFSFSGSGSRTVWKKRRKLGRRIHSFNKLQ